MTSLATAEETSLTLDASQFVVGIHDGTVTVHNPATGNHRTFQIRTVRPPKVSTDDGPDDPDSKNSFFVGKRIVSLLIGPDRNDRDCWLPFGFASERGVNVWKRFRGDDGQPSDHEKFARILSDPRRYPSLEFLCEAKCRRCGRPLTVPSSIATGLGPTCSQKV